MPQPALVCAAAPYSARVHVRIQCNTFKHKHSKGTHVAIRAIQCKSRSGTTDSIEDALHFRSQRLRMQNLQRTVPYELEATRPNQQSSVHHRHMIAAPIRGCGRACGAREGRLCMSLAAPDGHEGDEGHAQSAGTRAQPG